MLSTELKTATSPPRATQRFEPWSLFPVVLLGGLMSLVGTLVFISTQDPGFAVEADYYQKAVAWDAQRTLEKRSEQLGWRTNWQFDPTSQKTRDARLSVELTDTAGRPIEGATVHVIAFHNARASDLQDLSLVELGAGRYGSPWTLKRDGVWEFRLDVRHQSEHFSSQYRTELYATRVASEGTPQ